MSMTSLTFAKSLKYRSASIRVLRRAVGLSGAGGIYAFAEISDAAATLEDAAIAELADSGLGDETDLALDSLLLLAGNCVPP